MNFLRKIFVVLFAMLMLVSSSGVFVMIHKCLSSKKTEVSFVEKHKCCGSKTKKTNSCSVEKKCCSVDYQYYKLNTVSLSSEKNPTPEIVLGESALFNFDIFLNRNKLYKSAIFYPPLLSQNISIEFRQLLI